MRKYLILLVLVATLVGAGYWLPHSSLPPDTHNTPDATTAVDSRANNQPARTVGANPDAVSQSATEEPVTSLPKHGGTVVSTTSLKAVKRYVKEADLTIKRTSKLPSGEVLVTLAEPAMDPDVQGLEAEIFGTKVSTNQVYRATLTPNDANYSDQWNIRKIQAQKAWDKGAGSEDVTIAVIDTGVLFEQTVNGTTYTQPDFPTTRRWENTAELEGVDGLDDDDNGKIDDFYGWDFMGGYGKSVNCPNYDLTLVADPDGLDEEDNDPGPYSCDSPNSKNQLNKTHYSGACNYSSGACYVGHGTMVASVAAAATNNNALVAGIDNSAKIMNLRVLDGYGFTTTDRVAAAVEYAVASGADVINMSLAVSDCSVPISDPELESAMAAAKAANVVVVAASGNESIGRVCYPARSKNAIAIGASTSSDKRASFSNYGLELDLLAPGQGIPVANAPSKRIDNNYYASADGTSLATPHAAGTVAFIKALDADASWNLIYRRLTDRANRVTAMKGHSKTKKYGYGRLDTLASINATQGVTAVYRLYNSKYKNYFYTQNIAERNHYLDNKGYRPSRMEFWLDKDPADQTLPVYRYSHPKTKDHWYIVTAKDRATASKRGYKNRGIAYHALAVDTGASVIPVYRLYHPKKKLHFYTRTTSERTKMIAKGYSYRGVGWYGLKY